MVILKGTDRAKCIKIIGIVYEVLIKPYLALSNLPGLGLYSVAIYTDLDQHYYL